MEIKLRPANRKDVPALQAMAVQSYHQHFTYLWTSDGLQTYLDKYYDLNTFYDFLAAPDRQVYLACSQAQIAGYIVVHSQKNWQGDPLGFYVHRIYLLSNFAGQGVGSILMAQAEQLAREMSSRYLWLEVMQSSKDSIEFYRRRGFEIISASRFDILPMKTEELAKMWIMKKPLM